MLRGPWAAIPASQVEPVLTNVQHPWFSSDRTTVAPTALIVLYMGKSLPSDQRTKLSGNPRNSHLEQAPPLEWELENEIKSSDLLFHAESKTRTRD